MRFDPAYHLRTNKQVERALFADLLRRITPHVGISPEKYSYLGMGGPYLEDFVSVQSVLGCTHMTSLETQPHVIRRQKFNRPHCRVELKNKTTGWWIKRYRSGKFPVLAWLDYSNTEWKEQIGECLDLLPKLPSMSILKVTLICPARALGSGENALADRLERLHSTFGGSFTQDDVRNEAFPRTMKRIYAAAITPVFADNSSITVRPLAAYIYNDGTPVLTITL